MCSFFPGCNVNNIFSINKISTSCYLALDVNIYLLCLTFSLFASVKSTISFRMSINKELSMACSFAGGILSGHSEAEPDRVGQNGQQADIRGRSCRLHVSRSRGSRPHHLHHTGITLGEYLAGLMGNEVFGV